MYFQSPVSTSTVHELLFADICALNASLEMDMQRCMDLLGTACDNCGLVLNTENTVVVHQITPSTASNAPQINVNGALFEAMDNCTYVAALSFSTPISLMN
nr:unnamed protein product [Spirometra erinaceieuropaei]